MDRRNFLKDLGLLGLGTLLIPKGRSMIGWTRAADSPLYLKTYDMGFCITDELLEDSLYAAEDIASGQIVTVLNSVIRVPRVDYDRGVIDVQYTHYNKVFHRETPIPTPRD